MIDYASLRQGKKGDFQPLGIIELVQAAGWLVACVDPEVRYPKRSFCVLELFAAVVGRAKVQCVTQAAPQALGATVVQTKSATTRDLSDKEVIDDLIKSTVGFPTLDRIVSMVIQEATPDQIGVAQQKDGSPNVVLRDGVGGQVLAHISNGTQINILERRPDDWRVRHGSIEGWVKSDDVAEVP